MQVLVVKSFDLCFSECAWDRLSKWFIEQFYFSKTIATMQKATGLLSQTLFEFWIEIKSVIFSLRVVFGEIESLVRGKMSWTTENVQNMV